MKNNFIKKNMIIILFLTLFSAMVYSETKFRVSGKVVNHGKGISGIEVSIFDKIRKEFYSCVTNENGEFSIYLLNGKYSIDCDRQKGYYDSYKKERVFEVKDRNIEGLIIEMIKSARVCGKVITKDKKLRVRTIVNIARREPKNIEYLAMGSELKKDGSFCMEYIKPSDKATLMIKPFGFTDWIIKEGFSLKEGDEIKGVVIEIPKVERTISGRLIDSESGKSLILIKDGVDKFVVLLYEWYDTRKPITPLKKVIKLLPLGAADVYEDGNFYFYNVKPGKYILKVHDRYGNYKDLKMTVIIKNGKKINLMIKMNKKGGGKWEEVR